MKCLGEDQAAAVQAACAHLAAGGRATIVAAAGTGKTRTGAEASRRIAPAGRVLAVVASPALLARAAAEWADWLGPDAGRLVAVPGGAGTAGGQAAARGDTGCPGARAAAGPAELARLLAGGGRVSVLCTYASLPAVAAAHRDHGAPPWDLVLADDAHLAAVAGDGSWAVIHRDEMIPASRRLYLTATPQITDGKAGNLAGMDDQNLFGPVVHRTPFARAAELGIVARWRVAAAVVTSAEAVTLAGSRRASSMRMAAAQLALGRAITEWDLRRVITYHDQEPLAQRFAATLGRGLARMDPAQRPARPLTASPAGPGARPAGHQHDPAAPGNPGGRITVTAAVPGQDADVLAADAVAFTGLKTTPAQMVAALGQALRRRPGASTPATVTIIVPVLLPGTGDPAQPPHTAVFDTVWKVVRALRAHDERLAGWLDTRRAQRARPTATGGTTAPSWLRLLGPAATPALITSVTARMVEAATTSWPEHYAALQEFHASHGHADLPPGYQANGIDLRKWQDANCAALRGGTLPPERAQALEALGVTRSRTSAAWQRGLAAATAYHAEHGHLRVPPRHVTSDGFALYNWLASQRKPSRRRALTPAQAQALDDLGFNWDPDEERWETAFAQLRAFRHEHGHADAPLRYVTPGGLQLGQWLSTNRRGYHAGTLAPSRAAALEQLGVTWDLAAAAWEHNRQHLAGYVTEHGHARVPQHFTAPDGCPLGRWVSRQRTRHNHLGSNSHPLTSEQITSLTQLGMIWGTSPPKPDDSTRAPQSRR